MPVVEAPVRELRARVPRDAILVFGKLFFGATNTAKLVAFLPTATAANSTTTTEDSCDFYLQVNCVGWRVIWGAFGIA